MRTGLNVAKIIGSRVGENFATMVSPGTMKKHLPTMEAAKNILIGVIGNSMVTGQKGVIGLDFDGTLGHTKEAMHASMKYTHLVTTSTYFKECEDHAIEMVNGQPEFVFKKHFGERGRVAQEIFESRMDITYPKKAELMPGVGSFIKVAKVLEEAGIMVPAIVSFMDHNRLNKAADNLGIKEHINVVEGTKNEGKDKTTQAMWKERIFPQIFKSGENYGYVLQIGDSRSSDLKSAEAVPNGQGKFIAFGKGNPEQNEETKHPHIPDWEKGTKMFILATREALQQAGKENKMSPDAVAKLQVNLASVEAAMGRGAGRSR